MLTHRACTPSTLDKRYCYYELPLLPHSGKNMPKRRQPGRIAGCWPGSALPVKPLSPEEKEREREEREGGKKSRWVVEVGGGAGGRHGRGLTHSLVICTTFSMAV